MTRLHSRRARHANRRKGGFRGPRSRDHTGAASRLSAYPVHRRYLAALRRLADHKVIDFYNLRIEARFDLWPSQVFGRSYFIAWAEPTALAYLAPGKDAFTVPVPTPGGADLPVVIAPSRRARSHSEEFRSNIEHELVHLNQVLTDLRVPVYHPISASAVLAAYYQDLQIEHEAYLVQSAFWPLVHRAPRGLLRERVETRAQPHARTRTSPRNKCAMLASHRRFSMAYRDVPRPKTQLAALGYDTATISTFTERWPADVVRAYYHLADRGVPIDDAVRSTVLLWGAQKLGVTSSVQGRGRAQFVEW